MRLPPLALCLLLLALALPTCADPNAPPRPSNLRSDILYTHAGEFVQVSPMRPLTLNAHVKQFAYDPLGLEIAYVGSEPQGNNTLHFVKTIDVRTGREISRFAFTAPSDSQRTALMLRGWSTSGKYLMLQRSAPDPNQADTTITEYLRWDLSADPPSTRIIDPEAALPPEEQSADLEGSADCYPSPDGRWLVITQSIHTQKDDGKPGPDKNAYLLYNTEHDTFRLLTLPPKVIFLNWCDTSHLMLRQNSVRKQYDVVTGEISPLPAGAEANKPAVSKQYPDLSLDAEAQDISDLGNSGAAAPAYVVWIRRTPFGKLPLGAAAAGVMPRPAVTAYPGSDDPAAMWSPTGKQVAFVANGDLCVTDLMAATDLLPHEKIAVGLKLSCEEERQLAESNLKQIGLGLIQFIQDNDENYPASGDFMAKVYPYIKTMDVFSVGGHNFVYEQPADLALSKMDSPATTENGYIDLPCARVALFADGHVKVFPKEPTP